MSPTRDPFQSSLAFLTRLKYGGPVGKITALAVTFFIADPTLPLSRPFLLPREERIERKDD